MLLVLWIYVGGHGGGCFRWPLINKGVKGMKKLIYEYEIVDHGVEHEQYFQGCGVSWSQYDEVYTGIGASMHEALDDAAEQAACSGWEISSELNNEIETADKTNRSDETKHTDCGDENCFADGVYYYASIRLRQIKVISATTAEDGHRIGIHLLSPTEDEINDALDTAAKDMFPAVIIHTADTWAKRGVKS